MNMETDMVKKRIAECDRLLAYENKIVAIIGGVATGIVLLFVFLL